jgi:cytochrome c oxidase subunit 3
MSDITIPASEHVDDHSHDHPAWLAHHFDDAEQQFDSGKLGMWLFLVTEVLFFSGMFVAYALFRSLHPEVFVYASQFLNAKLGAINTGVLLFSSLTMAWAVRAAQLSQQKILISMLAMTLSCAAMFLGVKAVEYTHKWDLGLLPAGMYVTQGVAEVHHSDWLQKLCMPPAVLSVIFAAWFLYALVGRNKFQLQIAGPLLSAALCFFAGVQLGVFLESGESHGDAHGSSHGDAHGSHHSDASGHGHAPTAIADRLVSTSIPGQAFPDEVMVDPKRVGIDEPDINQRGRAGIFFGIYYMMTGIHAVHILGGMAVITWLIVKAARHEFHSKYFGPVDNVGLYWHLVDFIWIFLFPLLYLIR